MNRLLLATACLALLAAPGVFAHTDGGQYGTPKTYCENLKGDTNVHDYAVNGFTGVIYILFGLYDGNVDDCDGNGTPYDNDGHGEWSQGGAFLAASDWGAPFSGSTVCWAQAPHHPSHPNVWVFDHLWPIGMMFIVGADTTNFPNPTTGVDCGDGIDDIDTGYCLDHCSVHFPPGTDGTYHVYVVNEAKVSVDPRDLTASVQVNFAAAGHVYT